MDAIVIVFLVAGVLIVGAWSLWRVVMALDSYFDAQDTEDIVDWNEDEE